jgi:hypothetical protein
LPFLACAVWVEAFLLGIVLVQATTGRQRGSIRDGLRVSALAQQQTAI